MRLLCISSHMDTLNSVRPEAELFIGLQRRGLAVTVMTEQDSCYVSQMVGAGIKIIDFASRGKFDRDAIRKIRSQLKEGSYHVVFGFNSAVIANINFAASRLPVGVVAYRGQTGNLSRFSPRSYLLHFHPRIDLICAVADAVRDDLRAQHFDPSRVVTVYKGHDLGWYQDQPADLTTLGVPKGAFVVGCVANNRPRKGIPVLLRAVDRVSTDIPLHLLLIGATMDSLDQQIAANRAAKRIHILGVRQDAPALIAACNCSVLPALRREGLPKTVIESMVYSVPPIVTDTGGNGELVEHERSGLVVAPGEPEALADAMESLYFNPDNAARMGANARSRIGEHFNIAKTVEKTYQLLTTFPRLRRYNL